MNLSVALHYGLSEPDKLNSVIGKARDGSKLAVRAPRGNRIPEIQAYFSFIWLKV